MKPVCTVLAVLAALVPAVDTWATTTLATFADPSRNSSPPLFNLHYTQGELSSIEGGWSGTGLTLQMPFDNNSMYTDAKFSMGSVNVNPSNGNLTGGSIVFFKEKDNQDRPIPILNISWVPNSGSVNDFGMGARDKSLAPLNVTIQYKGWIFTNESFAFAFTNYTDYTDLGNGIATVTASFTSSFSSFIIPEPASLIILGLCGAMLAVRRRHR